jgi:hypothetical protein
MCVFPVKVFSDTISKVETQPAWAARLYVNSRRDELE